MATGLRCDTRTTRDYGLLSAPLSYMRSGDYNQSSATPSYRSSHGYYWTSRSRDVAYPYNLTLHTSYLIPQSYNYCGTGFAVYSRDFGLLSSPLSYVRSGDYAWDSTGLVNRGSRGYYWSLRSGNATSSNGLYFYSSALGPQYSSDRGYGFAVHKISKPKPPFTFRLSLYIIYYICQTKL